MANIKCHGLFGYVFDICYLLFVSSYLICVYAYLLLF